MLDVYRSTALIVTGLFAALFITARFSGAAELRVLSATAAQVPEKELAAEFTKETGHRVSFTFGSPGAIQQKVVSISSGKDCVTWAWVNAWRMNPPHCSWIEAGAVAGHNCNCN
jgi:ABC-type molybdate transport system substrate-binding protein